MQVPAYEGTDGELSLRPTLDSLRAFLDLNADYWLGGSGSAYIGWIEWRGPGYGTLFDRPLLHIIAHEPYGIHLCHQAGDRAHIVYNAAAPADLLVIHYLGGEPACLPVGSFVPRPLAEQVIADFLQEDLLLSGTLSDCVTWRLRRETAYSGCEYAP